MVREVQLHRRDWLFIHDKVDGRKELNFLGCIVTLTV
jgi:hypothetical protein